MIEGVGSRLARARRAGFRAWIHRRATRAGFDPRDLERFDRFLRSQSGAAEGPRGHLLQRPRERYPELTSQPWHVPAAFEAARSIEGAFPTVARESAALRGSFSPHQEALAATGAWSTYYLSCQGHRLSAHCEECPGTARLIDSLADAREAGLAYFSALVPGTHLNAHCGPTNTRLRCHLGLEIPDGCRLRVGEETRGWREGRCIVFDDSFEHEVWIEADRPRVVLIVDLWHPELNAAERWALTEIRRLSWGAWKYWRAVRRASA